MTKTFEKWENGFYICYIVNDNYVDYYFDHDFVSRTYTNIDWEFCLDMFEKEKFTEVI